MKHRTSIAAALLLLMFLLSNTCTAYAAENLTLKRTTVALGLGEKAACIQFNNSRIHPTDCTEVLMPPSTSSPVPALSPCS